MGKREEPGWSGFWRESEGVAAWSSLLGDSKEQHVPIMGSDSDRWSLKIFFEVDSNELVGDRK